MKLQLVGKNGKWMPNPLPADVSVQLPPYFQQLLLFLMEKQRGPGELKFLLDSYKRIKHSVIETIYKFSCNM